MRSILLALMALYAGLAAGQTYEIRFYTDLGKITVMLYDETPLHRDNMLKLVREHYYDSLLFHRVIDSFVVQGGDPTSKYASDTAFLGEGDLGYTIPAEILPEQYFHKRGAFGQARDDNPQKASSACQFYIVKGKIANDSSFIKAKKRTGYDIPQEHQQVYREMGGIPHLDSNYTVYGEVVKGMKVVEKISKVKTDDNDRPIKNVRIRTVKIVKGPE